MRVERVYLSQDQRVHYTAYIQDVSPHIVLSAKRPAMVVCPGGGYQMTSDREAEPIALYYLSKGFNAFVLRYSVGEHAAFPNSLVDLSMAMKNIRERADEYLIDPDKIAVCGFSAGGHLAATLGTLWKDKDIQELASCKGEENKPNGLVLAYPVISSDVFAHAASFVRLSGNEEERKKLLNRLSCEKHVGLHTPPSFLFHTFTDKAVPVENSLIFASSLASFNIPFELHVFHEGHHGLSLANNLTYHTIENLQESAEIWIDLSCKWLWNLFDGKYSLSR